MQGLVFDMSVQQSIERALPQNCAIAIPLIAHASHGLAAGFSSADAFSQQSLNASRISHKSNVQCHYEALAHHLSQLNQLPRCT